MKAARQFLRFYLVPLALLAGLVLAAGFTAFYTFTARTGDGGIVATNYPRALTLEFSKYLVDDDGAPAVTDEGKAVLEGEGLWLQVLDETGAECLSYNKPLSIPAAYAPYELLRAYQYGSGEWSVFVSEAYIDGEPYTYLLGFPMEISKVTMYIDAARYSSGKVLVLAVVALTAVLVITLSVYSYRSFIMSEKRRRQDEQAKEEWLANITHDLKTPLAPIRGYGELLAEGDAGAEDARRYGAIILKNVLYTEQLVDDLKLTYQLQSNMLPLNAERQNIVSFARELIIDILNTPEYERRSVDFLTDSEELLLSFDARLLRRALGNIIVNALKHTEPGTEVSVAIESGPEVRLRVADKGGGMSPQDLERLFSRYYRGSDTRADPEGSGLGMAIAKQIVEAHGGRISAESSPGTGTTVTVTLPN